MIYEIILNLFPLLMIDKIQFAGIGEVFAIGLISILIFKYIQEEIWGGKLMQKKPKCVHGNETEICLECKQNKIRLNSELSELNKTKKIAINKQIAEKKLQELIISNNSKKIEFLKKLNPYEFETVIGKMFEKLGFKVKQTPKSSDMGLDLLMKKNNEVYLVECKKYDETLVSRPEIQKFFTACYVNNATESYFITTSDFANTAIEYVENLNGKIKLINGIDLIELMKSAFSESNDIFNFDVVCEYCGEVSKSSSNNEINFTCRFGHVNNLQFDELYKNALDNIAPKYIDKSCPLCKSKMVLRKGHLTKNKFWGCSNYPKCKGTRQHNTYKYTIPKTYI